MFFLSFLLTLSSSKVDILKRKGNNIVCGNSTCNKVCCEYVITNFTTNAIKYEYQCLSQIEELYCYQPMPMFFVTVIIFISPTIVTSIFSCYRTYSSKYNVKASPELTNNGNKEVIQGCKPSMFLIIINYVLNILWSFLIMGSYCSVHLDHPDLYFNLLFGFPVILIIIVILVGNLPKGRIVLLKRNVYKHFLYFMMRLKQKKRAKIIKNIMKTRQNPPDLTICGTNPSAAVNISSLDDGAAYVRPIQTEPIPYSSWEDSSEPLEFIKEMDGSDESHFKKPNAFVIVKHEVIYDISDDLKRVIEERKAEILRFWDTTDSSNIWTTFQTKNFHENLVGNANPLKEGDKNEIPLFYKTMQGGFGTFLWWFFALLGLNATFEMFWTLGVKIVVIKTVKKISLEPGYRCLNGQPDFSAMEEFETMSKQ